MYDVSALLAAMHLLW